MITVFISQGFTKPNRTLRKGPKARCLVSRREKQAKAAHVNLYDAMHQHLHAKVHGGDRNGGRSTEEGVCYAGRSVLSWTSEDEKDLKR